MSKHPRNIRDIIALSTDYLQKKGVAEPRLQAEYLIASTLGIKRLDLYMDFDKPLSESELEKCRAYLKRRGEGEPLEYIQGEVEFYGATIRVNPSVLIPRQETEILVDKISKKLEKTDLNGKRLWDICSGSGCIGIALKKKFPNLEVTLVDISEKATKVAKENAVLNRIEVEIVNGDLFVPLKGKTADFIVCNPPYISQGDFNHLSREVKGWEPEGALLSGETGMELYGRVAEELKSFLNAGGSAWFEIGCGQGSELIELFKNSHWSSCCIEKDWAGHDRFFSLENE